MFFEAAGLHTVMVFHGLRDFFNPYVRRGVFAVVRELGEKPIEPFRVEGLRSDLCNFWPPYRSIAI